MLSVVLSALVQLFLFTSVPYIFWRFSEKKEGGFFTWIGIKGIRTQSRRESLEVLTGLLIGIVFSVLLTVLVIPMVFDDSTVLAQSQFKSLDVLTLIGILFYAFIQTGLSEEIFFRGFLGKVFIRRLGYLKGNLLQAALFSLMHGLIFFGQLAIFQLLFILLITGALGYFMGYLNEKKAAGSLLPSWLSHGIANTIAALLMIAL